MNKDSDTTGFSRVEVQLHTRTHQLDFGKIPPTSVAWSFNFCHLLLVVSPKTETPRDWSRWYLRVFLTSVLATSWSSTRLKPVVSQI